MRITAGGIVSCPALGIHLGIASRRVACSLGAGGIAALLGVTARGLSVSVSRLHPGLGISPGRGLRPLAIAGSRLGVRGLAVSLPGLTVAGSALPVVQAVPILPVVGLKLSVGILRHAGRVPRVSRAGLLGRIAPGQGRSPCGLPGRSGLSAGGVCLIAIIIIPKTACSLAALRRLRLLLVGAIEKHAAGSFPPLFAATIPGKSHDKQRAQMLILVVYHDLRPL